MKRIVLPRGMGKTTKLLNDAIDAVAAGEKVIFICASHEQCAKLRNNCVYKIIFMTLESYLELKDREQYQNCSIYIDDLDYCVKNLIKQDYKYSLEKDDKEYENN